jgi:hypothetical protein
MMWGEARMKIIPWALLVTACTGTPPGDTAQVDDPAADACAAHAQIGNLVVAQDAPDGGAALAFSDTPYEVTLLAGAPGYLRIVVDDDTSALLFAGTADVVSGLLDPDGSDQLPAATANASCPEDIPEQRTLELTAGTWNLVVGPSTETSVWLLMVEVW